LCLAAAAGATFIRLQLTVTGLISRSRVV